jgi:hypothetical protein
MMDVPVRVSAVLTLALLAAACGPARGPDTSPAAAAPIEAEATTAVPLLDSEVDGMLPTPFTAEQIRAEWVEGFRLIMRRWALTGERLERWRVVAADAEGVAIEHATVDAVGAVVGEPATRRSTWAELRDHASFSTAVATRSRVTRSTALGKLAGWLYSVAGPEGGMTTEMFFADSLPGAPVHMTVWQEGEKVLELEQLERVRPPAPASE